jgi:hypothetical protein
LLYVQPAAGGVHHAAAYKHITSASDLADEGQGIGILAMDVDRYA